jgi:sirohydrochlorin ferrochelatase
MSVGRTRFERSVMLAGNSSKTGLILVDHGSKRQAANDMLFDVVALFRKVSGASIVEPAHMELAEPTIGQAFNACVRQGATTVVVHPYFLSPGKHSQLDIPRMVCEAAAKHPGVKYHVTPPLGLDEKIARLIEQRVNDCVDNSFACEQCKARGCCGMSPRCAAAGNTAEQHGD